MSDPFTFAKLVTGRENEFPTLARAAANTRAALDTKVEWVVNNNGDLATNWNYCQIFRFPYNEPHAEGSDRTGGHSSEADATTALLTAVEGALTDGRRSLFAVNHRAMGGVKELLGRDLRDDDIIRLRPLREPVLHRFDRDLEWIAETSLQALTAEQAQITAREEAIA